MSRTSVHSDIELDVEPNERIKRLVTNLSRKQVARYVARLVVLIGCIIGCTIQCNSILSIYLSYPTSVFVYMDRMEKLELPGLTICNGNRYVDADL